MLGEHSSQQRSKISFSRCRTAAHLAIVLCLYAVDKKAFAAQVLKAGHKSVLIGRSNGIGAREESGAAFYFSWDIKRPNRTYFSLVEEPVLHDQAASLMLLSDN
jgi:hypothetical protein